MDNYRLSLLIFKNQAKLSNLIEKNASYEKILRQSQILDKYVIQKMIQMNRVRK